MSTKTQTQQNSTPPTLSLFSLPHPKHHQKHQKNSTTLTSPLQTSISIPFSWEEHPGKPLPCLTLTLPSTINKSLELPPRLTNTLPSPTRVLEGSYNIKKDDNCHLPSGLLLSGEKSPYNIKSDDNYHSMSGLLLPSHGSTRGGKAWPGEKGPYNMKRDDNCHSTSGFLLPTQGATGGCKVGPGEKGPYNMKRDNNRHSPGGLLIPTHGPIEGGKAGSGEKGPYNLKRDDNLHFPSNLLLPTYELTEGGKAGPGEKGPYNMSKSYSFKFLGKKQGSFDGSLSLKGTGASSPIKGILAPIILCRNNSVSSSNSSSRRCAKGLFGSWRKRGRHNVGNEGDVHGGSFVFSRFFNDDVSSSNGGDESAIRVREDNFLGLSSVKSNFWVEIYGAFKQVIRSPTRSENLKKDACLIR